jgi:hypothetical protein
MRGAAQTHRWGMSQAGTGGSGPARPLLVLLVLGLLFWAAGGAALAAEVHGENSSFAGHGVALAWGILKAPVEDQSVVVVRMVPMDPGYVAVDVEGVDPFTQARRTILPAQPLGAGLEVRSARGTFADFPRREFHFYTATDWQAKQPSLTIYFMGVPDTAPEFLAEASLTAYLAETITKLQGGGRGTP